VNVPAKINSDGFLEIDKSLVSKLSLSENDLALLKKDTESTNRCIQNGFMKFDKEMNIIFDKRNQTLPFDAQCSPISQRTFFDDSPQDDTSPDRSQSKGRPVPTIKELSPDHGIDYKKPSSRRSIPY